MYTGLIKLDENYFLGPIGLNTVWCVAYLSRQRGTPCPCRCRCRFSRQSCYVCGCGGGRGRGRGRGGGGAGSFTSIPPRWTVDCRHATTKSGFTFPPPIESVRAPNNNIYDLLAFTVQVSSAGVRGGLRGSRGAAGAHCGLRRGERGGVSWSSPWHRQTVPLDL